MIKLIVTDTNNQDRLDIFLAGAESLSLSRNEVKNLIGLGHILVNEEKEKPAYRIQTNDIITILVPQIQSKTLEKEDQALHILYEDEDMMIIEKEPGQVVHPGAGNEQGTLVNGLLGYTSQLSDIGGAFRPGIVHRLDKETGGLLVVAKNNLAHENIASQFKLRQVKREYAAFVEGLMRDIQGEISTIHGRNPRNRQEMAVVAEGREAKSYYQVESYHHKFTYITVGLITGRTHQIRVQMAHLHHPIVGDGVYGRKKPAHQLPSQALYAKTLGFLHPTTKAYMEWSHELPDFMTDLLHIVTTN